MGCAGQLCGRALLHGICWAIVWVNPVTWDVPGNCVGEPHHMGCAGQLYGRAPSHGMCWAIVWVSPITWDVLESRVGEPRHMGCAGQLCGSALSHVHSINVVEDHTRNNTTNVAFTSQHFSTVPCHDDGHIYWTPDPGKHVNFVRDNHMIMYAVWIQLSI